MKYHEIKEYANQLRKNPTEAEKELWKHIRKKQLLGRKFLRQHPLMHQVIYEELFYYIPDFYCHKESLIIELDGSIHDNQIEKDAQRQVILENLGYKVIRFKNHELAEIEKVLKIISSHFSE
jgi:very-short-patch-repair endonuclease